jgi:hypothetical protein
VFKLIDLLYQIKKENFDTRGIVDIIKEDYMRYFRHTIIRNRIKLYHHNGLNYILKNIVDNNKDESKLFYGNKNEGRG